MFVFLFKLLGWTLLLSIPAVVVIAVMALQAEHNNEGGTNKIWRERFWGYMWNNNTPFFVLFGMFVITTLVCPFNFGPALWLSNKYPSQEQRVELKTFFGELLHGTNALEKSVSESPPKITKKYWLFGRSITNAPPKPKVVPVKKPKSREDSTWFYWFVSPVYFVMWLGYGLIAFHDEITKIYEAIKNRRHGERPAGKEKPEAKKEKDHVDISVEKFVKWGLLVEVIWEVVLLLFKKIKGNKS